ncbi:MAG: hypothetical protein U0163_00305 [Gemmatimonadaceae bacterium]
MIGNALLTTCVISIGAIFSLMQSCSFLIPFRILLWNDYWMPLAIWGSIAFVNLFAACYALSRLLFLKDTGQKLAHMEKQLRSGGSLSAELASRLEE